jgi:hypothetical protein
VNQQKGTSAKSGRFEALLDKLVLAEVDLELACGLGAAMAQVVATPDAIADVCDILRSVIADVRNIIYEANGLTEEPEDIYG